MIPKLLTTQQAADILGIKKNTMEGWRLRGEGPTYYKIGKLVKYAEADLDRYIDAQIRRSTSDNGKL